jgi:hypothetical protein
LGSLLEAFLALGKALVPFAKSVSDLGGCFNRGVENPTHFPTAMAVTVVYLCRSQDRLVVTGWLLTRCEDGVGVHVG